MFPFDDVIMIGRNVHWTILLSWRNDMETLWKRHCTVSDLDECASDPCQGDGTCVDRLNGYNCMCSFRYTGIECETGKSMGSPRYHIRRLIIVFREVSKPWNVAILRIAALHTPRQTLHQCLYSWWRHYMETSSALLILCVGYSPVAREFPLQRPVTRSFDVFFYVCLSRPLCK